MGSAPSFDRENMSKHPDPGNIKVEGYWAPSAEEKSSSPFPFPSGSDNPWPGKDKFLAKLREKEETAEKIGYRGMSYCRLVGKNNCQPDEDDDMKSNGNSEYKVTASNGEVVCWPEGYGHYIEVHNVVPSKEFFNFIMN